MTSRKTTRRNYGPAEVRQLIEKYEELKNLRGTTPGLPLHYLCVLVDVDRAVACLTPHEYQAVLLVGLIGLSSSAAGELFGVSQPTMWRRYERGLEMLVTALNGEHT